MERDWEKGMGEEMRSERGSKKGVKMGRMRNGEARSEQERLK